VLASGTLPVVDASALLEYLLGTDLGLRVGDRLEGERSLDAPDLIDVEVCSGLRGLERERAVAAPRVLDALDDLLEAPLVHYPVRALLPRIWELRAELSAYDAAYVALAEDLRSDLITSDGRLARSRGHRASVVLIA